MIEDIGLCARRKAREDIDTCVAGDKDLVSTAYSGDTFDDTTLMDIQGPTKETVDP